MTFQELLDNLPQQLKALVVNELFKIDYSDPSAITKKIVLDGIVTAIQQVRASQEFKDLNDTFDVSTKSLVSMVFAMLPTVGADYFANVIAVSEPNHDS